MSTETPDVRPGQVWADNDRRNPGRTLRVVRVERDARRGYDVAVCDILTMDRNAELRVKAGIGRDTVGTETRVAVKRMRPTATGYRLVSQPEETR